MSHLAASVTPKRDVSNYDRQKIISWFTREGLGSGTAGNKAATYLLISSDSPNEPPARGSGSSQGVTARETPQTQIKRAAPRPTTRSSREANEEQARRPFSGPMPLNINVQIHISAEATSEQIESIFAAMRRYLYDGTGA
jgi:hypothetical protein